MVEGRRHSSNTKHQLPDPGGSVCRVGPGLTDRDRAVFQAAVKTATAPGDQQGVALRRGVFPDGFQAAAVHDSQSRWESVPFLSDTPAVPCVASAGPSGATGGNGTTGSLPCASAGPDGATGGTEIHGSLLGGCPTDLACSETGVCTVQATSDLSGLCPTAAVHGRAPPGVVPPRLPAARWVMDPAGRWTRAPASASALTEFFDLDRGGDDGCDAGGVNELALPSCPRALGASGPRPGDVAEGSVLGVEVFQLATPRADPRADQLALSSPVAGDTVFSEEFGSQVTAFPNVGEDPEADDILP